MRAGRREARAAAALGRGLALPALVLALICLAAYWNSFRAGLLLDNQTIILKDTRLRSADWQAVRDIFTHQYWWPFLESRLFRPLTTLSYWFNFSVLGSAENPVGYHAVNLLLHWLNTVLAWSLVRAVTRRPWVALFAAAVFATHPLTVESVTNVVGRADLLAGVSVLGGLWLYRRYLASEGRRAAWWLAALGATYLAGVFCKESAVVLPGVMLLHDVWQAGSLPHHAQAGRLPHAQAGRLPHHPQAGSLPHAGQAGGVPDTPGAGKVGPARGRPGVARLWPAYLSVAPGLLLLLSARWVLFRNSPLAREFGSDNLIAIAPFWTGVMTALKVCGYYLALLIWPARLSCDYSYNAVTLFGWTLSSGQDLHAWLALAVLIGLLAGAVASWRRGRGLFFFLGFAAVTFLPTSNFLFPIGAIMAERFMYLPLVGLAAAAAMALAAGIDAVRAALPDGARHAVRLAVALAAVAAVAALTTRTVARNEDWASNARLWSASAQATPDSVKVIRALAAVAMDAGPSGGGADEALAIARRGVQIGDQVPLPLYDRPAALYDDVGRYQLARAERLAAGGDRAQAQEAAGEAVSALERARDIDQEINRQGRQRLIRRGLKPEDVHDKVTGTIYRNLGAAYLAAGRPQSALDILTYLQRTQPDNWDAHYAVGVAHGAAAALEESRDDRPRSQAHLEEAAVSLLEAVLLNPGSEQAWQTLDQVYRLMGASPDAVLARDGKWTLNMDHPSVSGHFNLACARLVRQLGEAGLTGEADRWRQRMIVGFHLAPATLAAPGPAGPATR